MLRRKHDGQLTPSDRSIYPTEDHLSGIEQLYAALETLGENVSRIGEKEARWNDYKLVAVLDNVHL